MRMSARILGRRFLVVKGGRLSRSLGEGEADLNSPPPSRVVRLEGKAQAEFQLAEGEWNRRSNVTKLICSLT